MQYTHALLRRLVDTQVFVADATWNLRQTTITVVNVLNKEHWAFMYEIKL